MVEKGHHDCGRFCNKETGSKYFIIGKNLDNIIAIEAGVGFSAASKDDGTLWTWGNNRDGQIGDDGTTTDRITPFQVAFE